MSVPKVTGILFSIYMGFVIVFGLIGIIGGIFLGSKRRFHHDGIFTFSGAADIHYYRISFTGCCIFMYPILKAQFTGVLVTQPKMSNVEWNQSNTPYSDISVFSA